MGQNLLLSLLCAEYAWYSDTDTDTDTLCCIEVNDGRVSQQTRSLSQTLQSALQIQANTKTTKAHKDL